MVELICKMVDGKFIVLEGLDGAGTTTQSRLLGSYFVDKGKEYTPFITREPTMYTLAGREIRCILRGETKFTNTERYLAHLFVADRVWHLDNLITPNRDKGVQVICDRHMISTLAYQSQGVPMKDLIALHKGLPTPDLTLFLEVPADQALARVAIRTGSPERYEILETLRRVAENYQHAIELVGKKQHVVKIDGTLPIDEVAKRVQAEVDNLYKR